ncbi:MAG: DUF2723 domain-containing protein [Deltaproteobacteria bacterium]|nr:DUF2723 domain-containing protein [Deltaproteobacteria bacterium]
MRLQLLSKVATTAFVLGAAALYLLWCAPGILIYDTAELSGAVFRLGVSHPPGQPTYSIIGKLAQLLPLGSISFRTNVLSAVGAAASLWLTARIARELCGRSGPSPLLELAPPLAVLALGTSGPFVNQATRAEVYSPALACVLAALVCVCGALHPPGERPGRVPLLAAAGIWAGLAATLHPAAGLGAGIVGLLAVILLEPGILRGVRSWLYTVAGLVAGNAPQAFIVLRCRAGVEPCWEPQTDVAAFWRYVSGAAFRRNVQSGAAAVDAIEAALDFAISSTGFAAMIVVGLVIVLGLFSGRRIRDLACLSLAILVPFAFLAVSPFNEVNPDTQGYLLPSLSVLFAAAPVCALSLASRVGAVIATTIALSTTALAVGHGAGWSFARAGYYLPADLAERAFSELGPKALVVTKSDHLAFGMQYGQLAEGARPDVGVMIEGLAGRSQHWREVARRRPEIDVERARPIGGMELHGALAYAALQMTRDSLGRWVESPWVTDERKCITGALMRVGPCDGGAAELPISIEREFQRRRREYSDGTDRVIRLWRWNRAWAREANGEIDAAVGEIRAALWEDRAELDARLAGFQAPAEPLPAMLTPPIADAWIADVSLLRASLAQFLYRGRRTDLALEVLDRDFRAGNPQAALVLAEILLRDGHLAEAARIYRTFARTYPEHAGYALVGLSFVEAARGDARGAEAYLARVGKGAGTRLLAYRDRARRAIVPAILRSRDSREDMIRE